MRHGLRDHLHGREDGMVNWVGIAQDSTSTVTPCGSLKNSNSRLASPCWGRVGSHSSLPCLPSSEPSMALGQFTAEVEAGLPVVDRTGKDPSIHWECVIITLKILLFHIPKGIKLATHEMKKNSSSKTKPDQTPNSTFCIFSRDTPPPRLPSALLQGTCSNTTSMFPTHLLLPSPLTHHQLLLLEY